jgi:hypothetical protein
MKKYGLDVEGSDLDTPRTTITLSYFYSSVASPTNMATDEEKESMKGVGRRFLNFALKDLLRKSKLPGKTIITLDAQSNVKNANYKECNAIFDEFKLNNLDHDQLIKQIQEINMKYYIDFVEKMETASRHAYEICDTLTRSTKKEEIYKAAISKYPDIKERVKRAIDEIPEVSEEELTKLIPDLEKEYPILHSTISKYGFIPFLVKLATPGGRRKNYLEDLCRIINNNYLIVYYKRLGFDQIHTIIEEHQSMISTIESVIEHSDF